MDKIVVKAVPNPMKQMSKAILRHTLINNIFDIFVDFLIFMHFHQRGCLTCRLKTSNICAVRNDE